MALLPVEITLEYVLIAVVACFLIILIVVISRCGSSSKFTGNPIEMVTSTWGPGDKTPAQAFTSHMASDLLVVKEKDDSAAGAYPGCAARRAARQAGAASTVSSFRSKMTGGALSDDNLAQQLHQ